MTNAPELFDSPLRARSLAYLFLAGALMAGLTLVLPHGSSIDETGLGATGCAAALIGAALLLGAERAAMWQIHCALAIGTAMVALANELVGGSALYPLLFSWPILYAFCFLHRRAAIAQLALAAIAYAVVLIAEDPSSAYVRWLLAIGGPAVAGLLISRLLDRVLVERAESQKRQRLLEQSDVRTRIVLNSAPDPFVAIDREGVVRAWNAAAERKLGWPASEAIGRPFAELAIPPEQREAHNERRRTLLDPSARDATRVLDVELQARDGRRFPVEARVSRVTLGDEVFAAGFLRDISDRERREAERAELLREQAARAEAERVAEMVSGMQRLVDAALAHRTRPEILAELVTSLREVVDAESAAIYVAAGDHLTLGAASGGTPGGGGRGSLAFGEGFAGRVAAAREPMLSHPNPVAMIGVPLLAGGEVTGVLVVCAAAARSFSSDDFNLLRLSADRVALALDHAGLYERELKIAETLQRSLLPDRLPKTPGLEVAARYLPAAAESEVGGDWYDVLPVPGGGIGLVMGDIAGKGLTAASMVGRLRSALRAYAIEGHPPAVVVSGLNRLIWSEGQEGQMATLLFVVVDPAEGRVAWVNAGHPPPLLISGDDEPRYLRGGGSVPLGVLPFPDFKEVSTAVEAEATVVLYTDGLVERPGENIDLGLQRLAELVRAAPKAPDALCDELLRSLVADGAPSDDVALLALRTLPLSNRLQAEFAPEPEALASLRALLRRWLRHVGADDDEAEEIVTACGEAATNSIEHSGASESPFEVSGRLEGRRVELSVHDSGAWRPAREEKAGRGVDLMRGLMDEVEVTATAQGTTVRMSRKLQRARD